jgi:hypothetical protein
MNCNLSATRAIAPYRIVSLPARCAFLLLCALALCAFAPEPASALNLSCDPSVNNSAAVMELVCAIRSANASSAPCVINLFSNGVYTLTKADNWEYGPNGLPQISGNLTINGQGATIQRAPNSPNFRFFYISGGLSSKYRTGLPAGTLALTNLTLSGGTAVGGNGVGQGGGGAGGRRRHGPGWHLLPRRRFWRILYWRWWSWRQFGSRRWWWRRRVPADG